MQTVKSHNIWKIFTCTIFLAFIFALSTKTTIVHAAETEVKKGVNKTAEDILKESTAQTENHGTIKVADNRITYNNKSYTLNKNLQTTLFIGVDNLNGEQQGEEDTLANSGMADCLLLVITDKTTKKSKIIGINRDTMAEVDMFDTNGDYIRTSNMQIALSHGYGDGKEQSCLNTVRAVTNLLGGIKIDHYAALKMAAIPIINDEVGGVTVEVLEDMKESDPSFIKGETILLQGETALKYVRSRDTNKLDSNQLRMQRQKQYISAFTKQLSSKTSEDPFEMLDLYQKLNKYVVTDLKLAEMQTVFEQFAGSELGDDDFITVPGKLTQGKIYAEFIVDETALKEMVLDVFYNRDNQTKDETAK